MSSSFKNSPAVSYELFSPEDPAFQEAAKQCRQGPARPDIEPLDHSDIDQTIWWFSTLVDIAFYYSGYIHDDPTERAKYILTMVYMVTNAPSEHFRREHGLPYLSRLQAILDEEAAQPAVPSYSNEEAYNDSIAEQGSSQQEDTQAGVGETEIGEIDDGEQSESGQKLFVGPATLEGIDYSRPRCMNCRITKKKWCSRVDEGQQGHEGTKCHRCKENEPCIAEPTKPTINGVRPTYGRRREVIKAPPPYMPAMEQAETEAGIANSLNEAEEDSHRTDMQHNTRADGEGEVEKSSNQLQSTSSTEASSSSSAETRWYLPRCLRCIEKGKKCSRVDGNGPCHNCKATDRKPEELCLPEATQDVEEGKLPFYGWDKSKEKKK
ncbi:hypothetical protein EG329_011997 [Mollisiaceae sp. DMI_Dod_QoI]|nr:hypothetical protein EG329_011997 [Helotiales sp. DMI_Dod_QoI]